MDSTSAPHECRSRAIQQLVQYKYTLALLDAVRILKLLVWRQDSAKTESSNVSKNVYILIVHKSQAASPGFDPSSGQVRFQVDEVILG
jgi:hypothetical protein